MIRACSVVGLLAAGAAAAQGFNADFYEASSCSSLGRNVTSRIDPVIDYRLVPNNWAWPDGGTGAGLTARWSGVVSFPVTGEYRVRMEHDDIAELKVDGLPWTGTDRFDLIGMDTSPLRTFAAGDHVMEVCYSSRFEARRMSVQWMVPDAGAFAFVPTASVRGDLLPRPDAGFVNFDGIAAGTVLSTQLASQGVTFDITPIDALGFFRSRPRVEVATNSTASFPRLLRNGSWDAIEGQDWSSNQPLTFRFTRLQSYVSLSAGTDVSASFPPPRAVLSGYNSSGQVVASAVAPRLGSSTTTQLRLLRGSTDISYVTLDYGPEYRDERMDSLRFDAFSAVTLPPDLTPPALEFVGLTPDQDLLGVSAAPITVRITEATGSVTAASLTVNGFTTPMYRDDQPGCAPPTCTTWTGSPSLVNGLQTLTATATDASGNTGTASIRVNFAQRTVVVVTYEDGTPAVGAEVYLDRDLNLQRTDATGRVYLNPPRPAGTRVLAKVRVDERGSYRANHSLGSTQNWIYRVYLTSAVVNNDGSLSTHVITDPSREQRVRVLRSNVLFGVYLTISLDWDALADDYAVVTRQLNEMSDFLYNATDGQLYIEQAELMDRRANWTWADMMLVANVSLRAFVSWPRGNFLGENFLARSRMHLPRTESGAVFAHEFGHYGMELGDEYVDDSPAMCTAAAGNPDAGVLGPFGASASCIMWFQGVATKLCSNHSANPHVRGLRQGDEPCFGQFVRRYAQPGLTLKTPETRGAIVGAVSRPVDAWLPRITVIDTGSGRLCRPITVTVTNGAGVAQPGVAMYLRDQQGSFVRQGRTNGEGQVTLVGAHVGDRLYTNLLVEAGDDMNASSGFDTVFNTIWVYGRINDTCSGLQPR